MRHMNRFSFQGCETVLKHAGMTADQLDISGWDEKNVSHAHKSNA